MDTIGAGNDNEPAAAAFATESAGGLEHNSDDASAGVSLGDTEAITPPAVPLSPDGSRQALFSVYVCALHCSSVAAQLHFGDE